MKEGYLKIINIAGDSIQPTFERGDLIFVDISKDRFDGDGIYVFTFGVNIFVKPFQMVKSVIQVLSDNPTYKDWELTSSDMDQLLIHGKVMLSQSSLVRKHG